jgi:hypothetical protein
MRSRLDAVMDDPVARGKDGARLAARQTSTRSPGRSAPCANGTSGAVGLLLFVSMKEGGVSSMKERAVSRVWSWAPDGGASRAR